MNLQNHHPKLGLFLDPLSLLFEVNIKFWPNKLTPWSIIPVHHRCIKLILQITLNEMEIHSPPSPTKNKTSM
jgi:hypothetical protein